MTRRRVTNVTWGFSTLFFTALLKTITHCGMKVALASESDSAPHGIHPGGEG
jgi:hypothetical protein